MEWNGRVRQKPGVKTLRIGEIFIPNSNAIYLHDTPKYLLVEKKSL
jgi:murein L,D-transpeptidase YcbB/YkuD